MSENMQLIGITTDALESFLRRIVREEIGEQLKPPVQDEIGGIDFAATVTGLQPGTIYKKVARCEIPFRQKGKGGKITFSRLDLESWQNGMKRKTNGEVRRELALK